MGIMGCSRRARADGGQRAVSGPAFLPAAARCGAGVRALGSGPPARAPSDCTCPPGPAASCSSARRPRGRWGRTRGALRPTDPSGSCDRSCGRRRAWRAGPAARDRRCSPGRPRPVTWGRPGRRPGPPWSPDRRRSAHPRGWRAEVRATPGAASPAATSPPAPPSLSPSPPPSLQLGSTLVSFFPVLLQADLCAGKCARPRPLETR